MAANYVQPAFGKTPFKGYCLWLPDDGVITTPFNGQADTFNFATTNNESDPMLIDASEVPHNTVTGVRTGTVSQSGPVAPDRGFAALINSHWGPRSSDDNVPPLIGTVLPEGGGSAYVINRVWFDTLIIAGQWGVAGAQSMVSYALQNGFACDPDNLAALSATAKPASSGATGLNISSFRDTIFSDGAATGAVVYDAMSSFRLMVTNGVYVVPVNDATLADETAGCRVGVIRGSLTLTQMRGASNAIPLAQGGYPITLRIPTGDKTYNLDIKLATRRDASALPEQAGAPNRITATYRLVGGYSSNGTSSWPIVAAYGAAS